jgi:hypothetical protein
MLRSIEQEKLFKPVNLVQFSRNIYFMAFLIDDEQGKPDGGHHRAYAHYLANKPLSCRIVNPKWIRRGTIDIRDLIYK